MLQETIDMLNKIQNPDDFYLKEARRTDFLNRALFVETMNKFYSEKLSGPCLQLTFVDYRDEEDMLVVKQHDMFALINTHMNSIDATHYCLVQWVSTGDCAGYNGILYHADELPTKIKEQLQANTDWFEGE